MTAAAPAASTGVARDRASSGYSRIWRMTKRMRLTLNQVRGDVVHAISVLPDIRYGVGPLVGVPVDTGSSPRLTWTLSTAPSQLLQYPTCRESIPLRDGQDR